MLRPMEKKELNKFNDFIIKVKRVFVHDIYLIRNLNGLWILGGAESNLHLTGDFILQVESEYLNLVMNVFNIQENEYSKLYVSDIGLIKKGFSEFEELQIREISDQENDEFVSLRMVQLDEILQSDKNWYPFRFSENVATHEEIAAQCFDKLNVVKLPDPEGIWHDAIIGKSMLPGIGKKDLPKVVYRIDQFLSSAEDEILQLNLRYDFSYYCLYGQYFYI